MPSASCKSLSKIIVEKLDSNSEKLSEQFFSQNKGITSKFFIVDDLLPEEITFDIYENFPNKEFFMFRDTFQEKKLTFKDLKSLENPLLNDITDSFQMDNVINSIEKITKISQLRSDPSLYAGGLSRMDYGHFLNPHIDNSHDANRKRYRRFNLLFYVTPKIKESDGGNFELWDERVKNPFIISAKFNRLVVLETTKHSWHSVDPILSNIHRCCVSNYYFSDASPESYEYYNVTSFTGRPDQKVLRFYGKIDNLSRNYLSKLTGFSRGRKNIRPS
jgi:Rps23 Pro-64 3,4-dihydroxylase Tpa1-like proline 4-hydroxylase